MDQKRGGNGVENSQRNVSPMSVLIFRANTTSGLLVLHIQLSPTTRVGPLWPSSGRQYIIYVYFNVLTVKERLPPGYSLPCMLL
jgi:hypothetical protein